MLISLLASEAYIVHPNTSPPATCGPHTMDLHRRTPYTTSNRSSSLTVIHCSVVEIFSIRDFDTSTSWISNISALDSGAHSNMTLPCPVCTVVWEIVCSSLRRTGGFNIRFLCHRAGLTLYTARTDQPVVSSTSVTVGTYTGLSRLQEQMSSRPSTSTDMAWKLSPHEDIGRRFS